MPIRTAWEDQTQNLIHITFEDKWSITDFHTMIDEIRQMRSGARHRIDIVLDFTASFSGYNLNLLSAMSRVERLISNHTGITLLVKPPAYVKYLVGVVEKFAPRITEDLHIVDSLAGAYELLERKPPEPSM